MAFLHQNGFVCLFFCPAIGLFYVFSLSKIRLFLFLAINVPLLLFFGALFYFYVLVHHFGV
ncbi:hypothetical protein UA24_18885 [Marinomonas sp. BSi20414]|nr:hypothetical protein [Marinomonas sp. BSi20414]